MLNSPKFHQIICFTLLGFFISSALAFTANASEEDLMMPLHNLHKLRDIEKNESEEKFSFHSRPRWIVDFLRTQNISQGINSRGHFMGLEAGFSPYRIAGGWKDYLPGIFISAGQSTEVNETQARAQQLGLGIGYNNIINRGLDWYSKWTAIHVIQSRDEANTSNIGTAYALGFKFWIRKKAALNLGGQGRYSATTYQTDLKIQAGITLGL